MDGENMSKLLALGLWCAASADGLGRDYHVSLRVDLLTEANAITLYALGKWTAMQRIDFIFIVKSLRN